MSRFDGQPVRLGIREADDWIDRSKWASLGNGYWLDMNCVIQTRFMLLKNWFWGFGSIRGTTVE